MRDITDRMDLNRGTFYLHYADTYDLLQSVEEDALESVQELIDRHWDELNTGETLRPLLEPLLDYVVEHRALCASLFGNSGSSAFTNRVHRLLFDNGSELIRTRYPDAPEEQMGCLLDYAAFGLIGLLKHWFGTDAALSKEALLSAADRLVSGAARGLLEEP